MQMNASQPIAAPRSVVWAGLNDPDVLRTCIPGCESLELTSPTEMTAKVKLKVGPVSASFSGKVTLSDLDPPNSYRISGEGSGGIAGFAKGGAEVRLEEDGPDATILHYSVDAQIGGKLAQLGSRLIDSTAKRLAGEFFEKFAAELAPAPEAIAETADPATEAEADTAKPASKGWFKGLFGGKAEVVAPLVLLAGLGFMLTHACCLGGASASAMDPLAMAICSSHSAG